MLFFIPPSSVFACVPLQLRLSFISFFFYADENIVVGSGTRHKTCGSIRRKAGRHQPLVPSHLFLSFRDHIYIYIYIVITPSSSFPSSILVIFPISSIQVRLKVYPTIPYPDGVHEIRFLPISANLFDPVNIELIGFLVESMASPVSNLFLYWYAHHRARS